jgi:hypothetical protein
MPSHWYRKPIGMHIASAITIFHGRHRPRRAAANMMRGLNFLSTLNGSRLTTIADALTAAGKATSTLT